VGKAHTVLIEMAIAPLTDEHDRIVTCPQCQSPNFYQGYKSMKGAKGVLSALVSFMFLVFPVYFENVNKCKDCGYEFETSSNENALKQGA
jgi:DNA-directed RNA polymerase subunit RPC12/RpoP